MKRLIYIILSLVIFVTGFFLVGESYIAWKAGKTFSDTVGPTIIIGLGLAVIKLSDAVRAHGKK